MTTKTIGPEVDTVKPDTVEMESHEAASIFPLMEGAELDALADDIAANGLTVAIWTVGKKILDGRNRYRACAKAGVVPTFREFTGDDPVAFVLSMNLARRHLTVSQRAMVAERIATLRDGQNKGAQSCAASQADAAKAVRVSRRQVQKARVVRAQAKPEDVAAVERGEKTINAVLKEGRPLAPKPPSAVTPLPASVSPTRKEAEVRLLRKALRDSESVIPDDESVSLALSHAKSAAMELLRLKEPALRADHEAITASVKAVMDALAAVLTWSTDVLFDEPEAEP